MTTLAINSATGDLEVTNNNLVLASGADEVDQALACNLGTYFGEWFLDVTIGVPYYDVLFTKFPNQSAAEAMIKAEILGTVGVLSLLDFSLTLDTSSARLATCTFSVQAYDGSILQQNKVIG